MSRLVAALVAGLVALLAALTVTSQSPAAAARLSFDDKEGDATARFDIVRVTADNAAEVLSAKVTFVDLKTPGTQSAGIVFRSQGVDGSYAASSVRRADGTVTNELWFYDGDGGHHLTCEVRARWRAGQDLVKLRVPQGCLTKPGRAWVSAFAGPGEDAGNDPADWTRTVPVPFD